jgi:anti-sigma factor RsiW
MNRSWPHWRRRTAQPSGLTCRELVELVTDYLDGALDAGERARFESHIGACDGCTAYLEQMRLTIAVAGTLEPEGVSPEAERDLLRAFQDWRRQGGAGT